MNINLDWLKLPEKNILLKDDIDDSSVTELHKKIIQKKPFLRRLYADWYEYFRKETDNKSGALLVELGSGGGFLKKIIPNVITSDILFVSGIDLNFSVLNMPFKDNSVNRFFMLDVLHHIKDLFVFFRELNRCLVIGGKVIMVEPASTSWARFVWKNFHHEDFNLSGNWHSEDNRPLSSANSAIPWIVFFRDREIFKSEFPSLKVNSLQFHTPLRYLLSGGFTMRQLSPFFAYDLIKGIEFILSPFNKYIAMFLTIELEKTS